MILTEFLRHFEKVAPCGSEYEALCPAHDDRQASLAIGEDTDTGNLKIYCHKGCSAKAITSAVGLSLRDLYNDGNKAPGGVKRAPGGAHRGQGMPKKQRQQLGRVTERYTYTDEQGRAGWQVLRYEPKTFRQKHKNTSGRWAWGKGREAWPPYQLHRLVQDPDSVVYVVEGEKDADALWQEGLLATCNPGGAGKWPAEYAKHLQGRDVVLLPDNDEAGRDHMEVVGSSLRGWAGSIRTLQLPGLAEKGDVSDWLAAGGDGEGLDRLAQQAPEDGKPTLELVYLHDSPPEPTRWAVRGVLPLGACLVLGAEEKTGKTWVSFDLAICLATGGRLLGSWQPEETGKTLIYSPESGWNARKSRLWGLCWGRGLDPREVLAEIPFIKGRVNLGEERQRDHLANTVAKLAPRMLVIDPLITAHEGIDENASSDVQPVLNAIRDVSEACPGTAVVVAHHLGKGHVGKSAFHGLRGSSAIGAWADGRISLARVGEEPSSPRRVDIEHRDAPSPEPAGYELEVGPGQLEGLSSFKLSPVDAAALTPSTGGAKLDEDLKDEIAALVDREPGQLKRYAVAKKLGQNKPRINRHVAAMEADGMLCRTPDGFLCPGPAGLL